MPEVVVLVPKKDNDDNPFSAEQFTHLHDCLEANYRGYTCFPDGAFGFWIDAATATKYRDTHRVYIVALDSLLIGERIRPLVEHVKTHFGQEAVYVHYAAGSEVL